MHGSKTIHTEVEIPNFELQKNQSKTNNDSQMESSDSSQDSKDSNDSDKQRMIRGTPLLEKRKNSANDDAGAKSELSKSVLPYNPRAEEIVQAVGAEQSKPK